MNIKHHIINVRLDRETYKALKEESKQTNRSISYIVQKMLKERYEGDKKDD